MLPCVASSGFSNHSRAGACKSSHFQHLPNFMSALPTASCLLDVGYCSLCSSLSQSCPWSGSFLVCKLHRVCATAKGLILQEFHNLVNPKTKLISLVHVSNTLGTILSTEEVVEAAQKVLYYCNLDLPCLALALAMHVPPSVTTPTSRFANSEPGMQSSWVGFAYPYPRAAVCVMPQAMSARSQHPLFVLI